MCGIGGKPKPPALPATPAPPPPAATQDDPSAVAGREEQRRRRSLLSGMASTVQTSGLDATPAVVARKSLLGN